MAANAREMRNDSWVGRSPRDEEVLRKGIENFCRTTDKETSGKLTMWAIVTVLCMQFQRQGIKSIDKVAELTDTMWQNNFVNFPTSLLASIKEADAAIPRERIGNLLRQALRVGATEEQVDDAFEQPEPRQALFALIKSLQDWSCAGVTEVLTITRVLIIGSSGDGKSTIINNLKSDAEHKALVSMEVKGTTKKITEYRGRNNTIIMDTPGVGDYDVSVLKLYTLLEEALSQNDRRVDYVVVTTPLNNVRFHLALQIVQLLVKRGFHNDDGHEWNHIIVCGTKKDRAEPEELESFQLLVDAFYEDAPHKTGPSVMVDQNDISELENAISKKISKDISFQAVGEKELAIELSAKLGFKDNDEFLAVLRKEREQLKATQNVPSH